MRVVALAADEGPCGWYRIIAPSEQLIAGGADITIERKRNNLRVLKSTRTGEVRDIRGMDDVDVVVIQRPFDRDKSQLVGVLQSKGIAVVIEVDDHVGAIDRQNIAFAATNPQHNPASNYVHVSEACKQADLVVVTTPALARVYGGHGRVRVIPNAIPAAWLDIEADREGNVVGWPATVATHPKDLQTTKGMVARAVLEHGWRFRAVGDGHLVARHLRLPEIEKTGRVPYEQYPLEVARLDVGIVPLDKTPFNEAKSWLKGMEMAALGVPFVASDSAEYRALSGLGAGAIAATRSEWFQRLTSLMKSAELRAEMAGRGREVAAANTIEGKAHLWWEAWEAARAVRSPGVPTP